MKTLNFNGEKFQAEKIIKTTTDITGQDTNSKEIFAFRGISNFAQFAIQNLDGTATTFDTDADTDLDIAINSATTLDELKKALVGDLLTGQKGKAKGRNI